MSLKQVYDKASKQLGYEKTPPSIKEFLENPYYLGEETNKGTKVFPYWKNKLEEWFPTPFYQYDPNIKMIILSGATGVGKCLSKEQEIEIEMSEEDIKRFGLEEYIV